MRTAVFAAALALSTPALAQQPPRPSAPPAQAAAPPGPRTASPTQLALMRGMEAYRRREWDAALSALRDAAAADARAAAPQLYIGYVHGARGDAATALGSFREAQRLAAAAGDDAGQARALEAIANTYEVQGQWNEALAAWEAYVAFGDGHASAAFPAVGRARIEAIRRRAAIAQEYQPVRERIAERVRVNASGQNQRPPAPPPR